MSSAYLILERYRDALTEEAITDAVVTATLFNDKTDAQLGTPYTLTHVSQGTYREPLAYNHPGLEIGLRVRIEFFADAGSGKRLTDIQKAVVRVPS
jgi:hypothetical protein